MRYLFLFLGVLLFPLYIDANTLVPDLTFLHGDIRRVGQGDVLSPFQNPVGRRFPESDRLFVQSTHSFWGYQHVFLAYEKPLVKGQMFFGMSRFGADDNIKTAVRLGDRPQVLGRFSHRYEQLVFGGNYPVRDRVSLGWRFHYVSQTLDTHIATTHGFDIGGKWWVNDQFWLGGYTLFGLFQPLNWQDSVVEETLEKGVVLESGYRFREGEFLLQTQFSRSRLSGQWQLSPVVSVLADGVVESGWLRTGFGVQVETSFLTIHYMHLHYPSPAIESDQDTLGITLAWE